MANAKLDFPGLKRAAGSCAGYMLSYRETSFISQSLLVDQQCRLLTSRQKRMGLSICNYI
jgi:hypothetical protein